MRLVYSPRALADLKTIGSYISRDDVDAAARVITEIRNSCRLLLENPHLGHVRSDLTSRPVRFWPVRRTYLVVYEVGAERLLILRIFHGSQDISSWL
jgi:addiction module RelE/StbE family toxin